MDDEILHWYIPMFFYIGLSFMEFDVNSSIVDEGPLVNTRFMCVCVEDQHLFIKYVPHNYFVLSRPFFELNHL